VVGLVVESGCRYFAPIAYPDAVQAGVRVARIGTSSVRYEVGLFRNGEDAAAAEGFFIHVYVDRESQRPVALPERLRAVVEALCRAA
jgi:acyl-CoA thioester hydrolase